MSNSIFTAGGRIGAVGANTGSSNTVQANASGTAFTKGPITELTSSWPFDSESLWVIADSPSSGVDRFTLDILRGPAGSEFTIASNIWVPMSESSLALDLPIRVKAGERIAVQMNSTAAFTYMNVQMFAVAGTPHRMYGLGAGGHYTSNVDAASIRGTQVDPGGSGNTKGTWTTLVSSVNFHVKSLYVSAQGWNKSPSGNCTGLVDIGVGAGGSEQPLVPNLFVYNQAGTNNTERPWLRFPVDIPSGTRIASRAQSSTTNASDRLMEVYVMAFG